MKDFPRGITAGQIKELVGNSSLMLEIGCHDGEDTTKFIAEMDDIEIHCFEPDRRAVSRFCSDILDQELHCGLSFYRKAIADIDGPRSFYASTGNVGPERDWDYSGSLCKPTGHLKRSPEIVFKEPIEVECMRLDTWWSKWGREREIDFIWADVQGSQRLVIGGGREALAHTQYLYIESHDPPLYTGEPTQEELIELLSAWFVPVATYARENILFKNKEL